MKEYLQKRQVANLQRQAEDVVVMRVEGAQASEVADARRERDDLVVLHAQLRQVRQLTDLCARERSSRAVVATVTTSSDDYFARA